MSKIKDCADHIICIMTYSDKSEYITTESKVNHVIESMLIFLDYEDLINILNIVSNNLLPSIKKIFIDYITNKINDLNECMENEQYEEN